MGRSIVYCDKCGQLLKEEDFLQGKAFTADNRSYCAGCRLPACGRAPQPSKISSSRIPKQPGKDDRTRASPSAVPAAARRAASGACRSALDPRTGSKRLAIGLGVGALAVVAILAMAVGGSKPTRRTEEPAPATTVVAPVKPTPSENLPPESRRREETARTACVKAYEVQTTRPVDLAAQWRAFEAAAAVSQGTSYAGDAEGQLSELRRRFEEERAAIEAQIQTPMTQEQFRRILDRWESELQRFDASGVDPGDREADRGAQVRLRPAAGDDARRGGGGQAARRRAGEPAGSGSASRPGASRGTRSRSTRRWPPWFRSSPT